MDIRSAVKGGTDSKPGAFPPPGEIETQEAHTFAIPGLDNDGNPVAPDSLYGPGYVIDEYKKYLSDNGVTEDDIRVVLDTILSTGNVTWSFNLFDSIPVTLQMRPAWINDVILSIVDNVSTGEHMSMLRYNNIIAVCNLAASLVKFRDETYKITTQEEFEEARKRVDNMPYIIQNALVNKMAVFDRTVAVATSDWAIKNFTKPRTEK